MQFTTPLPFSEAIQKLLDRGVLPSSFDSHLWSLVATEIREKSFFSSQVESAALLDRMKSYIDDFLAVARDENGHLKAHGRSQFVADMRELAIREGLGKVDADTGKIIPEIRESDLTDIRSIARLQLIFDTQVEAAQEYGFWLQGQDESILWVYPCSRFIRVRPVMIPREYHAAHEGEVRRKDDLDFWLQMNQDFGVPWGPWGFNSGMAVEDVLRGEAEALGVIGKNEIVHPIAKKFNERLSAGVAEMDPGIAAALRQGTGGTLAGGRLGVREGSKTVSEALKIAGISKEGEMTPEAAIRLIDELKEFSPVLGTSKLLGIKGAKKEGVLTRAFVEQTLNDFTEFLPPRLAEKLPEITVEVKNSLRGSLGDYNEGSKRLRLSARDLASADEARKTMTHELLHWVHDHGGPEVEQMVRDLWETRTAGEKVVKLLPWDNSNVKGKRDKWMDADGDEYSGRIYSWENKLTNGPKGSEVLTRHLEKLSDPASLARHWNHASADGKHWWRETFLQLIEIFYL